MVVCTVLIKEFIPLAGERRRGRKWGEQGGEKRRRGRGGQRRERAWELGLERRRRKVFLGQYKSKGNSKQRLVGAKRGVAAEGE